MLHMSSSYEQALSELYRAPHEAFMTERRRLAEQLKVEGDRGLLHRAADPRASRDWHADRDPARSTCALTSTLAERVPASAA
jgi:hypothetical protein